MRHIYIYIHFLFINSLIVTVVLVFHKPQSTTNHAPSCLCVTGDSVFGSAPGLDSYDVAAGKELPSRSLKADRLKDRQELTQVLHIDKDHAASINARKTVTASTQT